MIDDVTFDVTEEQPADLGVDDPSSESADFAISDAIIEAVSPTVDVTAITGGHEVTITDINGAHSFDVMDGEDGATGPAGPGVPTGGSAGQVLRKAGATDYDTEWHTPDAADLTGTLPVAHGGTGATSAAGALTALGAAAATDVAVIGTFVSDSETVSLASNASSASAITSVSLAAGTWIVQATVGFGASATGSRLLTIATTSGSIVQGSAVQISASSVGGTYLHTGTVLELSSSGTAYLNARQNSGSALSTTGWIRAVRVK